MNCVRTLSILKENNFDIPNSMVQDQKEHLLKQFEQNMKERGMELSVLFAARIPSKENITRFAHLMRLLAEQNAGTFVGLPSLE